MIVFFTCGRRTIDEQWTYCILCQELRVYRYLICTAIAIALIVNSILLMVFFYLVTCVLCVLCMWVSEWVCGEYITESTWFFWGSLPQRMMQGFCKIVKSIKSITINSSLVFSPFNKHPLKINKLLKISKYQKRKRKRNVINQANRIKCEANIFLLAVVSFRSNSFNFT